MSELLVCLPLRVGTREAGELPGNKSAAAADNLGRVSSQVVGRDPDMTGNVTWAGTRCREFGLYCDSVG